MDLTKSLQDDIVKIQNELITAIQNHQVLVLRQQVSPSESIKTQIEEVQRHIICLGESQKILVSRLRNDISSQSLKVNNRQKDSSQEKNHLKAGSENAGFSNRTKRSELNNHSHFIKNSSNRDRSLLKPSHTSDSENNCDHNNLFLKERQPFVDSSSEENRTPCPSPVNGNTGIEQKTIKRSANECHPNTSPSKRPKSTLQATPRPSSPAPVRSKVIDPSASSSEESLDSLLSQQQQPTEVENQIDFAFALGLITNDLYNKVIKKKSERRRRKVKNHHHLYNSLWDLTVLQKRSRLKEPSTDEIDTTDNCRTPHSDCDNLCFVCQKSGELLECRVCHTGCHSCCISNNICPACTHQASISTPEPLIEEKKKKLEELRWNNKELHKSVAKLRERAKELSASLVIQTANVNKKIAEEEKLNESIKKLKDFIAFIQGSENPTSHHSEENLPVSS